MTDNFCLCGAQAGYPHDPCCPFPLYRASEALARQWQAAFEARQAQWVTERPTAEAGQAETALTPQRPARV